MLLSSHRCCHFSTSPSPTLSFCNCSLPQFFLQGHGFFPQGRILNCSLPAPQKVSEEFGAVRYSRHLSFCMFGKKCMTLLSGQTKAVVRLQDNLLWIIEHACVWSCSGRRRVFRLDTPGCFRCICPFRKSTCGCAAALIPCELKKNKKNTLYNDFKVYEHN